MGAGVGRPGGDDRLRAGEADVLGFPGVKWLQPLPALRGPHTRAACILPVGSEGAVLPLRTGGLSGSDPCVRAAGLRTRTLQGSSKEFAHPWAMFLGPPALWGVLPLDAYCPAKPRPWSALGRCPVTTGNNPAAPSRARCPRADLAGVQQALQDTGGCLSPVSSLGAFGFVLGSCQSNTCDCGFWDLPGVAQSGFHSASPFSPFQEIQPKRNPMVLLSCERNRLKTH